ncbi:MAG: ribonuclease HII [Candidatus Omnitrophota bacterium]|nr:ribonuclease HII [Candidatus Omnitrophota bacterium]
MPESILEINSTERLFAFDEEAANIGQKQLAGIDEAGRGPLAGPVVAAAVIFLRRSPLCKLNDSKKLRPRLREALFAEITQHALVGVGVVSEQLIEEINIYQATRLAMKRAVMSLSRSPEYILVDGTMTLDLPVPQKAVVKGDQKSASVAAASIVAKVFRDAWMVHLDELYPEYGFKTHKGYPTRHHLKCLGRNGPSPVHRKTFGPVRRLL